MPPSPTSPPNFDALRKAPMYYRGANAALLLYDITNAATFEDVRGWLEGIPIPPVTFVANSPSTDRCTQS